MYDEKTNRYGSDADSGMSRRRFLKMIGGTVVGAAALVALGGPNGMGTGNAASLSTQAAGGSPKDSFSYKGEQIQLVEFGDSSAALRSTGVSSSREVLFVNGLPLPEHAFAKIESGYSSHHLPFEIFPNARDLARLLIDNNGTLFIVGGTAASVNTSLMNAHALHGDNG